MKTNFLGEQEPKIIKQDTDNTNQEADFRKYIVELIGEVIIDLSEFIDYYPKVSDIATTEKDKGILRQIQLDKVRYKDNFEKIYKLLTGNEPELESEYEYENVEDSFLEEIDDMIEEELESLEVYRLLMSFFSEELVRDIINESIIGAQKHAQQLAGIYSRNK